MNAFLPTKSKSAFHSVTMADPDRRKRDRHSFTCSRVRKKIMKMRHTSSHPCEESLLHAHENVGCTVGEGSKVTHFLADGE